MLIMSPFRNNSGVVGGVVPKYHRRIATAVYVPRYYCWALNIAVASFKACFPPLRQQPKVAQHPQNPPVRHTLRAQEGCKKVTAGGIYRRSSGRAPCSIIAGEE